MPHMPPRGAKAPHRPTTVIRIISAAVAVGAFAGLVGIGLPQPSAGAATSASSSITVKWTGDTSSARAIQPIRDAASPHYDDLKNISVTVTQTANLTDQAVKVVFSGFGGGTETLVDSDGGVWTDATDFMQAMQCWGDPADANFRETCEWGGRNSGNNGLGNTVYPDNVLRIAGKYAYPTAADPVDVPFRTYGGTTFTGRNVFELNPDGTTNVNQIRSPILDVFGPSTTNEIQSRRANPDGSGTFDFEVQSADQAPQLGCGREGHLTCYLVLVPRGDHYGGSGTACSYIAEFDGSPYAYGRGDSIQAGSPLTPGCDYWNNRIVVPIAFNQVGLTCQGGAEQRVIGSQMLTIAMSSWQPALCDVVGSPVSFASNPDSIARLQLLDDRAGLAFASYPLTDARLGDELASSQLATTQVSYAPIAIGGLTVAFLSEGPNGRSEQMTLSPRLMAKLLTQSYRFLIPRSDGSAEGRDIAHLGTVNLTYRTLADDPEFRALNPDAGNFTGVPAVVFPGPFAADSLEQLWRWIIADSKAKAWLSGAADEYGMTINPYYLPKGDPNARVPIISTSGADEGQYVLDGNGNVTYRAVGLTNPDGTGMKISQVPLDRIFKADESLAPLKLSNQRSRYDSLQFSPYTETFTSAAISTFRANPGAKTYWDAARIDSGGRLGDWVSPGPQIPGQRFVIAITDVASAERYALSMARLQLPNSTTVVAPDEASMTAALSALRAVDNTALTQVDPAAVTSGYPLTTVIWGITNLTNTTKDERTAIAKLVTMVTSTGQTPGTQIGQLPAGYLPLTAALQQQASVAAIAINAYTTPTSSPTPAPYSAGQYDSQNTSTGNQNTSDGGVTSGEGVPDITPGDGYTELARTTGPDVGALAQVGLPVALGAGVLGAIFAPLLFRGRWLP